MTIALLLGVISIVIALGLAALEPAGSLGPAGRGQCYTGRHDDLESRRGVAALTSGEALYEAPYWEEVADSWLSAKSDRLWRAHSDAVNIALLDRWLPLGSIERLLKTDLFDEAVGDGLYPRLRLRARCVVGIDVSARTLEAAQSRHHALRAIQADVRRLPFAAGTFDVVVSNSTLDHFQSPDQIAAGLRELRRVLRPGGRLILTLDNLANPIIALRARIPFSVWHRLGVVPYYVGATYGPDRLQRALTETGFDVLAIDAVMHCPRVLAVPLAKLLERRLGPRGRARFLRCLMSWEHLARWRTRFRTGHFVVVHAARGTEAVGS